MARKELAYLSMSELSDKISKREISTVELVEAYLERVKRLDSKLHAYITICGEQALATAKKIDTSRAKPDRKNMPLLGLPITLKDQFDTARILTTNGSLALKDYIPKEDSTVVAKLKQAGAIILGKLNMSEFACGGGEDQPFGIACNPWNIDYSPAGSSSGSGIAVSAGLCAASVGEDTGGSGRGPANVCGIVGLRPSAGLISRYGIHPLAPSLDSASPLTRTVEDCAMLTQAIAGYDAKDLLSSRRPVTDYRTALNGDLKKVKVGIIKEFINDKSLDPEVRQAIETAVKKLKEIGLSVVEVSIPPVTIAGHVLATIVWSEGSALNRNWVDAKYDLFRQSTRLGFLAGYLLPNRVYQRARQAQAYIRAKSLEALEKCDVMLCATSPKLTPKVDDTIKVANATKKEDVVNRHSSGHTAFAALSGTPAISIPCGFSKIGLPIGMQIVGRPFEETIVFRVAHAYEQAAGWHKRHPIV